jgi:hypothetical protein
MIFTYLPERSSGKSVLVAAGKKVKLQVRSDGFSQMFEQKRLNGVRA